MDALGEFTVEQVLDEYKQWILGSTRPRTPVLPKRRFNEHPERNYNLKSKVPRRFLQHEKQTFGINLGWTDDAETATGEKVARWFFARNGSADGPIKYGEVIALGNGGDPSFLHYEERSVGINLNWSSKPVFEWMIAGGAKGSPVQTQEWIALVNMKATAGGEPLIYFDRTAGGDLGWPSSRTWGDQLKDRAWKLVKDEARRILLGGA